MRNVAWKRWVVLVVVLGSCGPRTEEAQVSAKSTEDAAAPQLTFLTGSEIGLTDAALDPASAELQCIDLQSPLKTVAKRSVQQRTAAVAEAFGIAKAFAANNEMHDCQVLTVGAHPNEKYHALASLWVSSDLKPGSFPNETVVAGIALAGSSYDRLGLSPGKNCVLVKGVGAAQSGKDWTARVVHVTGTQTCQDALNMPGGKPLNVFMADAKNKQIAGRWIDADTTYYIGLQCGGWMCVIGGQEPGEQPEGYDLTADAESDFQRLAKKNAQNQLVPSRLWGKIRVLQLADREKLDTYHDKWPETAEITFTGNDPEARKQYAAKYGVSESDLNNPIVVKINHTGSDPKAGWKIQYGNGTPVSADFMEADHPGYGTTRWRWSKDEGTWIQCAAGCCGGN